MPNETLFSTEYITVVYNTDKKLIHHTVHQPISGQAQMLKDALIAGSDALSKNGICKWLSDDRLNDPLTEDVIQWGIDEWQPSTIKAGWKYWANVVPTQVQAAGALVPVIENLHKLGLKMRVFTTLEDATEWLDSMPNS